jgi:hypothetical protein
MWSDDNERMRLRNVMDRHQPCGGVGCPTCEMLRERELRGELWAPVRYPPMTRADMARERVEQADLQRAAVLATPPEEALRLLDEATDPSFDRRARGTLRQGPRLEALLRARSTRLAAPAVALGLV